MLGSNFALLVKSPGDDEQQLLTTGSSYRYVYRWTEQKVSPFLDTTFKNVVSFKDLTKLFKDLTKSRIVTTKGI